MLKKVIIGLFLLFTLVQAKVSLKDTVIHWRVFDYKTNSNNTLDYVTNTKEDTITKVFEGKVIENEYLKITLLPEYGGRILSMVYKPTGNEQLYQNPVGNPYGIGDGNFYYDWLMVYGGIFPTLPEPEHGKAWMLPWEYEVLKYTSDTVRINMSWQDTVDLNEVAKFGYGRTNLKCDFEISLVEGKNALSTDISIANLQGEEVDYEYWTCLTLSPGSEPGNPKTSGETEMIMPYSKIEIKPWWNLQSVEEPIDEGNNIYKFDKLKYYKNWVSDGIIYPRKEENKNFWGAINHENEEGLIRVADNSITPGIKIWGWDYSESQNIQPAKNPDLTKRPYLELWAGHSNEFFSSASIGPNAKKSWKEIYIPTVGLKNVNKASKDIVANYYIKEQSDQAILRFVSAYPNQEHEVVIQKNQEVLKNKTVLAQSSVNEISVELPQGENWSQKDSLYCAIKGSNGQEYFQAAISLDTASTVNISQDETNTRDYNLSQNYPNPFNSSTTIRYSLKYRSKVKINIFDLQGRKIKTLVQNKRSKGIHKVNWRPNVASGIYYYRFEARSERENYTETNKLIYLK